MAPLPPWSGLHQRNSPRHPLLDYTLGGYWHITICVAKMRPLLGRQMGQRVELNGLGNLLHQELLALPDHYSGLSVDCCCIMPDHVHGLFFLNGLEPQRPDIRRVVQRLKSTVGGKYVRWRNAQGLASLPEKLFQRSFRDRYLTSEKQLEAVREYILLNPLAAYYEAREN